jgi:hypothetical protein
VLGAPRGGFLEITEVANVFGLGNEKMADMLGSLVSVVFYH